MCVQVTCGERYLARIGVIGIEKIARERYKRKRRKWVNICVGGEVREIAIMNGRIDYLSGIEWTPTNRIIKANTHVAMVRPTITPF